MLKKTEFTNKPLKTDDERNESCCDKSHSLCERMNEIINNAKSFARDRNVVKRNIYYREKSHVDMVNEQTDYDTVRI